jgi:type IV pilus assembly protein PilB
VDYLNAPDVKTISCEDPVEYVLDDMAQCSVNQETGPTFADSLRAIVRQDPDIIVVGEIRDVVTARLAVEATLTGHKVLSTFHTEDSVGAVVRLSEMGVEPYLIASTLSCVVAQRLARRICRACREPAEPSRDDLRFLGLERADIAMLTLARGAGCEACGGTGYRGRLAIHELLLPDDDFRDAVMRRAPSKELRALARDLPAFTTLQEAGVLRAAEGATTLAEVVANAPRDAGARRPAELREWTQGRRS